MNLKVLIPQRLVVEEDRVTKVIAEGTHGSFCLLPRHIDHAAVLVPGLLAFETEDEREEFVAIDQGMLVKLGGQVLVSVRQAVRGPHLGELRRKVKEEFEILDDRERLVRDTVAKLEANFVRRFLELGEVGRD